MKLLFKNLLSIKIMANIYKVFEMVEYNDYIELEKVIKTGKLDLTRYNKKKEYLINNAIKYRSKECFDLLLESKYFDPNDTWTNGFDRAIYYYKKAPNPSNYYYVDAYKNKNINIENSLEELITIDEYNDKILQTINEKPEFYVNIILSSLYNIAIFKKYFNIGISLNLITDDIINSIIEKLRYCHDHLIIDILTELINNNFTNFLRDYDLIKELMFNNFENEEVLKLFIKNLQVNHDEFSEFLIDYFSENDYNIFPLEYFCKNYNVLKISNCKFTNCDAIIQNILNKVYRCYNRLNLNTIELFNKTIDIFLEENLIDKNIKLVFHINLESIIKNNKYDQIQYFIQILNHMKEKGIDISMFEPLYAVKIPEEHIIQLKPTKTNNKKKKGKKI